MPETTEDSLLGFRLLLARTARRLAVAGQTDARIYPVQFQNARAMQQSI